MPTSRFAAPVAVAASLILALPAAAQHQHPQGSATAKPTSGVRAELIQDVEELESKYLGLAKAMSGKYDWRPAQGVRSVGEVFMHIAGDNYAIPVMVGVKAPQGFAAANLQQAFASAQAMEKVTDEAKVQEALTQSFAHAKQAIADVPEAQLGASIDMFGRPATKRRVLTLMVTHMHEHLGQAIAYARSNGVMPPWSANAGN